MKQCLECGTFSSDDTVFCSVCGKNSQMLQMYQ